MVILIFSTSFYLKHFLFYEQCSDIINVHMSLCKVLIILVVVTFPECGDT